MKKIKKNDQPACTCIFCSVHYYTMNLFQAAIDAANGDENQLYHTLFYPLARTTILNKFYGLPLHLLTDQVCFASKNLWLYWRTHSQLLPTQDNLNILRAISFRSGVCLYRKYKYIKSHELHPQHNTEKNDGQFFDILSIRKIQYVEDIEESFVSKITTRDRIISSILNIKTDAQLTALLGAVLLKSRFFEHTTDDMIISKTAVLNAFDLAISDYNLDASIKALLYEKACNIAGNEFSIPRLKSAAYNRKKILPTPIK